MLWVGGAHPPMALFINDVLKYIHISVKLPRHTWGLLLLPVQRHTPDTNALDNTFATALNQCKNVARCNTGIGLHSQSGLTKGPSPSEGRAVQLLNLQSRWPWQ